MIPYSEYREKNNMVLLKSYEAVTAMAVALSMSDNIWSSRGRELLLDAFTYLWRRDKRQVKDLQSMRIEITI